MPWQMAPPLIIIAGAFTATGYLLNLADRVYLGRNRRVRIDEFDFAMDLREEKYKERINLSKISGKTEHGSGK